MDSRGRQLRGSRVWIRLSKDSAAAEVVQKVEQQMACINCQFISCTYSLHHPDGRVADKLPASN